MGPTRLVLIAVFWTRLYAAHAACSDPPASRVDWHGCDKHGANLGSASLDSASLDSANLQGANLDSANLDSANLQGAYLPGADLQGANLQGANLVGRPAACVTTGYPNLSAGRGRSPQTCLRSFVATSSWTADSSFHVPSNLSLSSA